MSPSPLTLDAPRLTVSSNAKLDRAEREQQVAKLTKALYPVDKQERFLELQAEVETLFIKLQALQQVHR